MAVVFADLRLQQFNPAAGALQALVGARDPDVVPHKAADLIPVVADHHFFIRVRDAAFIPGRQIPRRAARGQPLQYGPAGGAGIDHAFQQGIAGHAVRAMQAGAAYLANRVQPGDIRLPVLIDHHAAAGVVRGRHHGQRRRGHVHAQFEAAPVDGREVLFYKGPRLVREVQKDAVMAEPLHFMVNRPRHDIARGQFGRRVVTPHERLAVGMDQLRALAAQGLGDQKGFCPRVIQTGRVKLDKFHIGDAAARAPGHGNPVARAGVGIAGVEINLAGPARGQHGLAGREYVDAFLAEINGVGAEAGAGGPGAPARGD